MWILTTCQHSILYGSPARCGRRIIHLHKMGFRIYVDIMTGKSCRQFRLIGPLSFIGQFVYPVGEEVIGYRKKTICSFKWSRTCANSSCGSLSNVWSILNMSRVSSENLACSEMLPTMITSCRVKVIMGERSSGGVINGLSR